MACAGDRLKSLWPSTRRSQKLAEAEPIKAQLVELRYFAGLTGEQAAQVLGISPATADRHWAYARAWLRNEVRGGESRTAGTLFGEFRVMLSPPALALM